MTPTSLDSHLFEKEGVSENVHACLDPINMNSVLLNSRSVYLGFFGSYRVKSLFHCRLCALSVAITLTFTLLVHF